MKTDIKEKLIANFKQEFRSRGNLIIGNEARYEGKEEMMNILFTRYEIQRFKNEILVLNIPAAIDEMIAFENKINELTGEKNFVEWSTDDVQEWYQYYKKCFSENTSKEFDELYERALKITERPFVVIDENSTLTDLELLSVGSQIKIESRNPKTFGCILNKTDFRDGKTYKVVSQGDGFGLVDEDDDFYHIDVVESYYHTQIV